MRSIINPNQWSEELEATEVANTLNSIEMTKDEEKEAEEELATAIATPAPEPTLGNQVLGLGKDFVTNTIDLITGKHLKKVADDYVENKTINEIMSTPWDIATLMNESRQLGWAKFKNTIAQTRAYAAQNREQFDRAPLSQESIDVFMQAAEEAKDEYKSAASVPSISLSLHQCKYSTRRSL